MQKADIEVLVVEDDRLLNWSLASSLSKWGFEVRSVFTGNDAVSEIQQSGFDIFLLDYQLPDLDGLSIARMIRKMQPKAAIFLITAYQFSELPMESDLIDSYFNKPVNMKQLHLSLLSIIQLGKREKRLRQQNEQSDNP